MILYFTATGNSRWIAELLAEAMHDTAVSIVPNIEARTQVANEAAYLYAPLAKL